MGVILGRDGQRAHTFGEHRGEHMTGEIRYAVNGELIEVKIPRCLVILTREEWARGIKRGKSIIRNRAMRAREAKALDAKVKLPRFE